MPISALVPPCLSATSLSELDLVFDVGRASPTRLKDTRPCGLRLTVSDRERLEGTTLGVSLLGLQHPMYVRTTQSSHHATKAPPKIILHAPKTQVRPSKNASKKRLKNASNNSAMFWHYFLGFPTLFGPHVWPHFWPPLFARVVK